MHKFAISALLLSVPLIAQPLYNYATAENNLVGVNAEQDMVYAVGAVDNGNSSQDLHIDVYTPVGLHQFRKAAVLYIHGGGFRTGNKSSQRWVCEHFSSRGFVTFSMQYRLEADNPPVSGFVPPEMNAAFVDAKAALRWIYANADSYGIDTANIFIGGTSAGAITSLFAGVTDEDEYITDLPGEPVPESNSPGRPMGVRGIIDFCGGMYWAVNSIDALDPPILIYHGTADRLVPFSEAEAVRDRCQAVGLAYEFYAIQGEGHCPTEPADNGKDLWELSFEFFRKHLRNPNPSPVLPELSLFSSAGQILNAVPGNGAALFSLPSNQPGGTFTFEVYNMDGVLVVAVNRVLQPGQRNVQVGLPRNTGTEGIFIVKITPHH